MSSNIAVFGSSGFIGRHLTSYLRAQGHRVFAVARPIHETSQVAAMEINGEIIRPKSMNADALKEVLEHAGCDAAVNLASYGVSPDNRDPAHAFQANTVLPGNLACATAKAGIALIHVGSVSEYAPSKSNKLDEQAALESIKLYGATKAAGMLSALSLSSQYQASFVGLRFFNVYGPDEAQHRLFPSLMASLSSGRRVPMSDGLQERDFIYVTDVCRAMEAAMHHAMQKNVQPEVYNVATGTATTVRHFAETVAEIGKFDKALLGFGDIARRPDDLPRVVGETAKISEHLGWKAEMSLKQGIESMVQEYQSAETQRGAGQ